MYNKTMNDANEFKARIRALVQFVVEQEKDGNGYSSTLMDLVDGHARLEAGVSWMAEQPKNRATDIYNMTDLSKKTIELPQGTRKVSIEL